MQRRKEEGNVVKISSFTHTPLSRYTYSAIAGYFQKGELWRVTYLVSLRTPEGGQAGKLTNLSLTHTQLSRGIYPAIAGYFGEGEGSDGKKEEMTSSEGRMVKVM